MPTRTRWARSSDVVGLVDDLKQSIASGGDMTVVRLKLDPDKLEAMRARNEAALLKSHTRARQRRGEVERARTTARHEGIMAVGRVQQGHDGLRRGAVREKLRRAGIRPV
jgi:hypothetical protein